MPRVRIPLPRTFRRVQVALWSLQAFLWSLPALVGWDDRPTFAAIALVMALVSAAFTIFLVSGAASAAADATGVRRAGWMGRRRVPWHEVSEIRPAPGSPGRLVIRGAARRTLVEGEMPTDAELSKLHAWHRAATAAPSGA